MPHGQKGQQCRYLFFLGPKKNKNPKFRMPIKTALTRALGIRHPVIQGGMHHVGFAPLAAAVSNAGGLGTITALTQVINTHLSSMKNLNFIFFFCCMQAVRTRHGIDREH